MADIRIKDLATTATTTASDDFMAVDGVTNGTRKLSAATPAFLTSVTTPSLTSPASIDLTLGTTSYGTALTVASATGAATFAGAVTVGGTALVGNGTAYAYGLTVKAAANDYSLTLLQSNVNNAGWGMYADTGGGFNLARYGASAYGTAAFTVALGGAISMTNGLAVTGTVSCTTGAAVGGATAGAGGLAFPATAVAVADANTLDDYEEGTWTPTLTPATSGTITLTSPNLCGYTKTGRVVTVTGLVEVSSVSSPVGTSVSVNNLPFSSNATNTQRSAGTAVCFALSSGTVSTSCTITSSVTTFAVQINSSLFQNGTQIYFQLTYTV